MSAALASEPCVLHAVPGRLRVHLPGLSHLDPRTIDTRLRRGAGVRRVETNTLTGNVLIYFDPRATTDQHILADLRTLEAGKPAGEESSPAGREEQQPSPAAHARAPRVVSTGRGQQKRARIAVKGLDRDPAVARRVVDRLQRHPGVQAHANPLTGRVLVEFDSHQTDIEDLLTDVIDVELPDLPDSDTPSHPLDPAPLIQSATRTTGVALGLGLVTAQQVAGVQISAPGAAQAAGILGILQGFPLTRNGLRAILGHDLSDLVFSGANIIALALSGSPLGLAVTGAEAVRLLTEVVARRRAFNRYEERLGDAVDATPGTTVRLDAGDRMPLIGRIVEGTGTAIERDGQPVPATPGATISAGARVHGGPFVVALEGDKPFVPQPRPAPLAPALADRYQTALGPLSLAYALGTAVLTRSLGRAFEALLLVNPRTALIGAEAASTGASARALRAGVTVVGTRPDRPIRQPDVLLVDGPRVLTDGLEVTGVIPLSEAYDIADVQAVATAVAAAAGSPWGGAFRATSGETGSAGSFDGTTAAAQVGQSRYTLGPVAEGETVPAADRLRRRGATLLVLRSPRAERPLAVFALRARLAPGVADLVATCRRHGIDLGLVSQGNRGMANAVAERTGLALVAADDSVAAVRARQADGALVALVSDSAQSAEPFAACDLAIGLTSGRSDRFAARADLLAPDLGAVGAIMEAGARRNATARDSVALSIISNVAGAVWGWRGGAGIERASYAVYITTLAALGDGWQRLRGGERPHASAAQLVDPRPERWGQRSVTDVLQALHASPDGLSSAEAAARRQAGAPAARRHQLARAILDQVQSPLTGILAAGAGLSLVLGSPLDFALIATTIAVNVAVGAWQERRAGQATAALEQLSAATACVRRDGALVVVPAIDVVPGDVLVLASGDRVAADARLLEAQNLEVDEAALTGESLPVPKTANGGSDASRVVLEGSDVTVGTGCAVVVAVGRGTRMGATAAALASDETAQSPLGRRLSGMLKQVLPLAGIGGAIVVTSGFLRGQALLPQLAIGASIAIAAVPEGLPLLAGVGQAAVAGRLAGRKALVRRLGAVEALGRVDVACTDKTGTLTEGRLALTDVADLDGDARVAAAEPLPEDLSGVLRAAGLASPHPEAPDVGAHPTDMAVIAGAEKAGLGAALRLERTAEAPFDPARAFHASMAGGQLWVKGATEALAPRCTRLRRGGGEQALGEAARAALQARAEELAARGLRVLMVATGDVHTSVDDPSGLTVLGFIGISDPLRADVPAAVRRCRDAGIRVVMLTGDSPATARAIGREAGVLDGGSVLTGAEIADLQNGELDRALEGVTVIARVTPLDKLRIVESLQRHGHTVAMTGDGVNDAPALRLADVGVAMGRGGTEVARQAADVVLADDDFATLVEALVEGRSFWRNIRRALGLLLGGNLGELGLVVGASVLGLASPLVTRQILAVNLITDALPALAVALQRPADRNLAGLAREGEAALETTLRRDVLRRGVATTVPALAGYLLALPSGLPQARAVAFGGIVATQLAQTLDAGRAEGGLTRSVLAAVAGSGALLAATLTVPVLREALLLSAPTPLGWALIAAGAPAAVLLSRTLGVARGDGQTRLALPAPVQLKLLAPPVVHA